MTTQQMLSDVTRQRSEQLAGYSPPPMKISRKNSANVSDDAATRKLEESRDALRQAIFQKTANEALKIPNGYLKVAVKIIRWNENIDDFKGHTQEVGPPELINANTTNYLLT